MGLDERFDALRRSRPATADVDTEEALTAVAARGGRQVRGRRGLVLAGAIAAAVVLVVGLVVVRAGDEDGSSVLAGDGEEEAPPPNDPGPARLWLSTTEVPVSGADVAAVILWDGDGETPTWGVPAQLDRWTGAAWDEQFTFTFCTDSWACSGVLAPAQGWEDIGVGPNQALWVRIEGLEVGTYRMRSVANDGVVAAGQFSVVDRAVDLPPAEHSDEVGERTTRLTVQSPLRLSVGGEHPLTDGELDAYVDGDEGLTAAVEMLDDPEEDLDSLVAPIATIQRWDDGAWTDVATTETQVRLVAGMVSVTVDVVWLVDPARAESTDDRPGDYRIEVDRAGGPALAGRFWVRDPLDAGAAPDTATTSTTEREMDPAAPAADQPPPDNGPARLWLSATEVPTSGADVAAVILWDGEGPSPTWGVAAALDRWTGTAWEEQVGFAFCVDHWACSGTLEPAAEIPYIGITAPEGRSSTLWVRVDDLAPGGYRIRSEASEGVVAAGQFEVVEALADPLPPPDHLDGAFLTVDPGLLPRRPIGSPATSDVIDVALSDSGDDPAATWRSVADEATIQRWEDGRWVDLATVPTGAGTGSTYAASIAVGDLLDRGGDLRVVIERDDGAPPLVGRFWASDAAGPRVSVGPDGGG